MSDVILGPTNPNHEVAGTLAEPGAYEIMFDPRNRRPRTKRQRLLISVAFVLVALLMVASLARLTVATPPKLRVTLVDAGQYGTTVDDLAKDFIATANLRDRDVAVTTVDSTDADALRASLRRLRRDNTTDLVIAPVTTFDRLAGDELVARFDADDVSALISAQAPGSGDDGDVGTNESSSSDAASQPPVVLRTTWYELPIDGEAGHAPGVGSLAWTCTQPAADDDVDRFASTTCMADVSGYTDAGDIDSGTNAANADGGKDGDHNGDAVERRTYAPTAIVAIPDDVNVTTAADGSRTWTQAGPMTIRQTAVYGLRMDTSTRWTTMQRHAGAATNARTDYVMGVIGSDQIQHGPTVDGLAAQFIAYLAFRA